MNGVIDGPVKGAETLQLQPNARVNSEVHYTSIEIQRGAIVEGGMQGAARALALLAALACAIWVQPACAEPASNQLPTGGQVAAGSVNISTTGSKMQIDQGTDKAILNWQTFSIGSGAWVNFSQPSASSVALNRVLGNNPSEIFGRLSANGQVFLTNQNGVLFGRSASVDVGALFATTLSIKDQDFLAGRYVFSNEGSAGSVVNQGTIITTNGYAGLAGPQVRNDGIIVARAGTVALAAGDRVTLDMVGDGLISLSVDQAALNASAINAGTIQADGGRVLLTARSANALLDTVINNTGIILANSLIERNGEIILDGGNAGVVSNSGTLQAAGTDAGATGGTVKVLGQYVGLFNGSTIDASGDAGGGTVLVGGNFHGGGTEQNASRTYVGPSASINADAVTGGKGGQVAIWSNDGTKFFGSISVRGGAQHGDGGFIEVSGKNSLYFAGNIDASAPNGTAGTLLLDPLNILVASGGTATTADVAAFATNAGTTQTISPTTLNNAGTTVVLQAANDITISDAVNLTTPGAGFVAQAGNDINVNATITTSGGRIVLEADSPHAPGGADGTGRVIVAAAVNSVGGAITLIGGGLLNPTGGFTLNADVNAGAGGINVSLTQTGTLDFSIGATGNTQLSNNDTGSLKTTGPLVLGTATTGGPDGQSLVATGALTLTVGSITNNTSSPI